MVELLAKFDKLVRPTLVGAAPDLSIWLYSSTKAFFIRTLANSNPPNIILDYPTTKLWDLNFGFPLFNSAGMFKYGQGYEAVAQMGAGAYICGTTTYLERAGNIKNGIKHPFIPLPKSGLAINWMGLPNKGHRWTANIISRYNKIHNCPLGASLATDPGMNEADAALGLLDGLFVYDKANVDFMEINESCPNVAHHVSVETINGLDAGMVRRLEFISKEYLSKRNRNLPVIVKYSVETSLEQIPALIDLLITLGYDGINFGNTAINYKSIRENAVNHYEEKVYDKFTTEFGGGVSGSYLNSLSLEACRMASKYLKTKELSKEFHVIRTGGISSAEDLAELGSSFSLAQWYTGFFENFGTHGFETYKSIANQLKNLR